MTSELWYNIDLKTAILTEKPKYIQKIQRKKTSKNLSKNRTLTQKIHNNIDQNMVFSIKNISDFQVKFDKIRHKF